MPFAPLRPCLTPGCPERVSSGRCALHAQVQELHRYNYAGRRLYRTARWQAVRGLVLQRAPLCRECSRLGRVTVATEVDHIDRVGLDVNRFFNVAGLQGLCKSHHSEKTASGR